MRALIALAVAPLLAACSTTVAEPPSAAAPPVVIELTPPPRPLLAADAAMIRYHVALPERRAHRVSVTMSFRPQNRPVEVAMPVWTPGSYLVREYARHVLDIQATDGQGRPLTMTKNSKNSWRIEAGSARDIVVEYELFANEQSVRTSQVDEDHAFLSPAGTFLFVRGRQDLPHHVSVETPDDWQVYTGLRADEDGWIASDYDELVDSPLEIGNHRVVEFDVNRIPHRIVVAGEGDLDIDRLAGDTKLICEQVSSVFGVMPFADYLFIVSLTDTSRGGLEHRNSSVNMYSRWKLPSSKGYDGLVALLAHEYFHAWNVKRLRPAALGPFDYENEAYTTDLWVVEGVTSYYERLTPFRAGVTENVDEYLKAVAKRFRDISERPGADRKSLTAASWDAWIKAYRPDSNSVNSTVSYYEKGELVALMLDLRIRRMSDGDRSLDDVLRLAWQRFATRDVGYYDGAFADLTAEVLGAELGDFFADYVDGTVPLDPDPDLAFVGLRLAQVPKDTDRPLGKDDVGFALAPTLGIGSESSNGLCRIKEVREGGAAWNAGLDAGDILLAIDGMRVTPGTIQDRLDRTAGRAVTITYYRGQSLRTTEVEPDLTPIAEWKILPLDDVDGLQREAFEAWLQQPYPEAD